MKATVTGQKLRGGYYTPPVIAKFLARWAVSSANASILEPSCGDGVILEAAAKELFNRGATSAAVKQLLFAVEFDSEEAAKAGKRLVNLGIAGGEDCILSGDFFAACLSELIEEPLIGIDGRRFDAIVGNPPFIRYQNFPEEHRAIAFSLMAKAGLHPNRLTNAWVPFLVLSSLLLREDGRLGMVIPAELFQVGYAAEVRAFLSNFFHRMTIVTFRRLVFDDIQQEIVLLLCERESADSEGIRVVELENAGALASFRVDDNTIDDIKPMDHSSEKWTQYFLDKEEIYLLRALRSDGRLVLSGNLIEVDVGVVTGENSFFVLNEQAIIAHNLENFTRRVVTRSNHLRGALFNEEDWCANALQQHPVFLLDAPEVESSDLPRQVAEYIHIGEEKGIHKGYKCRIRKKWYIVPALWVPESFMLRQVHGYPKLVLNTAEATCTDTIHRVRFREGVNSRMVTAAFLNSITFAFSEVTGRSYGGGVLTFEPSEAEHLLLPLDRAETLDIEEIDRLLRSGNINTVLDITDATLLGAGLGLTKGEILRIRRIWQKLRDRRIHRR